jgi:hypothetical protein
MKPKLGKNIPFTGQVMIAQLFEKLVALYGEDEVRKWFRRYGPMTAQEREIARDAALLVEFFAMRHPNQQELARRRAKEYHKSRETMLRHIQRLLNHPAQKYKRVREEFWKSSHTTSPKGGFQLLSRALCRDFIDLRISDSGED